LKCFGKGAVAFEVSRFKIQASSFTPQGSIFAIMKLWTLNLSYLIPPQVLSKALSITLTGGLPWLAVLLELECRQATLNEAM
jgi:hypothetical protein